MIKKVTFLLFFTSSFFIYSQTAVNDFETGSDPILNQTGGTTSSVVDNPNKTGLNTTDKCLEIKRTNSTLTRWWELVGIDVKPDLAISSSDTKYVSMMILYNDPLPDIGIRFDAASDAANGGATVRPINKYTKTGQWQEMVFEIKDTQSATSFSTGTLFRLTFHYDIGDQVSPRTFLTNNVDKFAYIDEVRILDSNPLLNNWLGTSSDWDTASNWSAGTVPFVHNDLVTIPSGTANDPVVSSTTGATTNTLTVNSGASLTINAGGSLIVSSTSTGNITYKRTLTKDAGLTNAWYAVSSPVSGATLTTLQAANNFAPGSSGSRIGLATYKNDGTAWNYFTTSSSDAISAGTGLIAKLDNGVAGNDLTFTGTYTGSVVEPTISQDSNNFNFVGNPFMAYLNLGTFFTDNNATNRLSENTIWIWDENKNGVNMGGYVSKTSGADASFEIAPGQGFFVSSGSAASNKITFNVANQSHKTDSFLKESNQGTEIKLFISQNNRVNSTRLFFTDKASTDFDNGFDASMFTGVEYDLAIYSKLVSGNNLTKIETQFLPNSDYENTIISLGVKAEKDKEITISADALNLPKGINVFLEDRQNNTFTNLSVSNYKVTLSENEDVTGRFFIRTSSQNVLSTSNIKELVGVNIYETNNNLRVTGVGQSTGTISIFNVLGKQIKTQKFSSVNNLEISLAGIKTGVYIVRLNSSNGLLNKKIILK